MIQRMRICDQLDAAIYSYSIPSGTGYAANGNVLNFTDSVVGSWMYSYDGLNRLASADGSSGSFNGQNAFTVQGAEFSWGYDSFGNRLTQGSNVSTLQSGAWAHYTAATNQVTAVPGGSLSYDNAGDVTNDTVNQYAYDAEGRVCAVWSGLTSSYTGYIYDGEGNRVAKGSINGLSCNLATNGFSLTKSYIYGGKGELLTEMGAAGIWNHSNVYADGRLLATYEGNDTYFAFNDWLSTKRVEFTPDSCMTAWASLPFGDDLTTSSTCPDASEQHFTGKERDTESGLDYFGARYYGSSMGRWTSPDPLPWLEWQNGDSDDKKKFSNFLMNPQNLNLYSYVLNNPIIGVDPDGMQVYVVAYTTGNSEGDEDLKRAAQTKADDIRSSKGFNPKKDAVVIGGVKTKEDFQNLLSAAAGIQDQLGKTSSVNLFSHSGDLDSPVFHDSSGHASQLTKGEIGALKVNWSDNASASFYGCRSADNFAQNFANGQHVRTYGFLGGVDFSGQPNSRSKMYLFNGQFNRYMIDQSERGLVGRDPK